MSAGRGRAREEVERSWTPRPEARDRWRTDTTTLRPTDSQSPATEPPTHLRGALRAAAVARAPTTRIRTGGALPDHAREIPVETAARTVDPADIDRRDAGAGPRAAPGQPTDPIGLDPGRKPRTRKLSFARTVAAAHQARSSVTSEGALDPWHLCLRAEPDRGAGAAWWLSRLLMPLRLGRRPTPRPELLSLGYDPVGTGCIEPSGPVEGTGAARRAGAAGDDHAPFEGARLDLSPRLPRRSGCRGLASGDSTRQSNRANCRKAIELDPDRRPGVDASRRLAVLGVPAGPE